MARLWCFLIGYAFGLFQTAFFYGKLNGIDIRTAGSGNAGTTNALRVLGPKAGLIVMIGDIAKTMIAIGIVKAVSGICSFCIRRQVPSSVITILSIWDLRAVRA